MKICFYMTTILEYQWWMEKWFIDTSVELQKRYPHLDITIVTRDNCFTEKIAKLISLLKWHKFDKYVLYKDNFENIQKKLWKVEYIKCNSFKDLKCALSNFDVIYSKNEILEAFIFKFIVWYKNIKKLIFWVHTVLFYPNSFFRNLFYTSRIYSFFTSWVNCFHVLNSNDQQVLEKLWKKVYKIFNPINELNFNINKENNFFKIDSEIWKYNIAWVWRLTKQKWINNLLEIIENINNNYNNVILHIVGDWEYRGQIKKITEKYSFLRYYSHIWNKCIPSFLSQIDLLIHTSLWESYWLTIIEANFCNIPVIAFDIPWPRDIIEDWKNWFLVKDIGEYFYLLGQFVNWKVLIKSSKDTILNILNDDVIYKKIYLLLINSYE